MRTHRSWSRTTADAPPEADGTNTAASRRDLIGQLQIECNAMARYALQHGIAVAPDLIAQLSMLMVAASRAAAESAADDASSVHGASYALAAIHRRLAVAIAPATPQAVTLLDGELRARSRFAWLGPVPLIRALTLSAATFLVAVIATSLSPEVSVANIDQGFLDSHGTRLLWNALFLMFCAGLGASFATLFQAHRYVANSTYDPKYDASYGARLILGVIAGLILVELLPPHLYDGASTRSFGKPALAMLGGFSATAVHRLLHRLVETLETLVRGDTAAAAQATFEAHRAHAATERVQWQSELAADLLRLQQSLETGMPADTVKQRLAEFTRAMLSADAPRTGRQDGANAIGE
ncbi:hypothetical protein [Burkholderia diffusa]|uniref:hypothetical protein n=1 Tax=Burkholderia diffusa TaxID=488732 RepID=UPI0020C6C6A1|nr:hypothetical protein [Burkholderia diffusa]